MSEPFVINVRFGPAREILTEMFRRWDQEWESPELDPEPRRDRGFQHFDFDDHHAPDPTAEPCVECGGYDGEHTGDCGAIN